MPDAGGAGRGGDGAPRRGALAQRGRDEVRQFYYKLDQQLATNEFLAGERFSIADITALTTTDFATRLKISIPDDAVHTRRWYASVSARPSATA